MDLDSVADELYGLPPDRFVPERTARVREARAAGDRQLAAALGGLRRPVASAWLVNLLARHRADELGALLALGAELAAAQAAGAGAEVRTLSARRRTAQQDLVGAARRLAAEAGEPPSTAVVDEVDGTLTAALADPDAAEAVRSGRLVKPLTYAGFGPVAIGDAVAVPPARRPPAEVVDLDTRRARRGDAAGRAEERAAAKRQVEQERAARERAEQERLAAEQARREAAVAKAEEQLAESDRALHEAQDARAAATEALEQARVAENAARREREVARKALEAAQRRLTRLGAST